MVPAYGMMFFIPESLYWECADSRGCKAVAFLAWVGSVEQYSNQQQRRKAYLGTFLLSGIFLSV